MFFEVTLVGFNGASDETDALVLWVIAENLEELKDVSSTVNGYIRDIKLLPDLTPEDAYQAIDFVVGSTVGDFSDVVLDNFKKVFGHTDIYTNRYKHCNSEWQVNGDSMHNDNCENCNKEIQPSSSLSIF